MNADHTLSDTPNSPEAAHAALMAFAKQPADRRTDLIGLERAELESTLKALGLPRFRADQVWHWMYHRGVTDFAGMTNLAKPIRAQLAEAFRISRPEVVTRQDSSDGTIKWLPFRRRK